MTNSVYIVLWPGRTYFYICSDLPPQFSEAQRFNNFLKDLQEKVEIKQLNHFWEIIIQGKLSFSSNIDAIFSKYKYKF